MLSRSIALQNPCFPVASLKYEAFPVVVDVGYSVVLVKSALGAIVEGADGTVDALEFMAALSGVLRFFNSSGNSN